MLSLQLLHPALSVSSGTLIGLTGETLCCFYANYSWSDCFVSEDASVSADKVGAVIVDGMSRFIPSSTKSFSPQNPWFDRACSRAIQAREGKNSPSPITLANFHSARNCCRDILRRAKQAFTKRRCAELLNSPTDKFF